MGPRELIYPAKGAYEPFEYGPRNCIGRRTVMLILGVVILVTVRESKFEPMMEQIVLRKGLGRRLMGIVRIRLRRAKHTRLMGFLAVCL